VQEIATRVLAQFHYILLCAQELQETNSQIRRRQRKVGVTQPLAPSTGKTLLERRPDIHGSGAIVKKNQGLGLATTFFASHGQ
jgi:hypothetical protein